MTIELANLQKLLENFSNSFWRFTSSSPGSQILSPSQPQSSPVQGGASRTTVESCEKASLLQQDLQVPPRRHSMPSAISAPRPSAMQILGCSAPRHQHGRHLAFHRQLSSPLSFKRRLADLAKNRILQSPDRGK